MWWLTLQVILLVISGLTWVITVSVFGRWHRLVLWHSHRAYLLVTSVIPGPCISLCQWDPLPWGFWRWYLCGAVVTPWTRPFFPFPWTALGLFLETPVSFHDASLRRIRSCSPASVSFSAGTFHIPPVLKVLGLLYGILHWVFHLHPWSLPCHLYSLVALHSMVAIHSMLALHWCLPVLLVDFPRRYL